jgi:hypothetical protein
MSSEVNIQNNQINRQPVDKSTEQIPENSSDSLLEISDNIEPDSEKAVTIAPRHPQFRLRENNKKRYS